MKTSLFDFELPQSLIATHPATPRDSARMLVVDRDFQDSFVSELPRFLRAGDVMVFNDTRVIPARLFGRRGEAKVEILLHKQCYPERSEGVPSVSVDSSATPQNENCWACFAKPAKRLKPGDRIDFSADFHAEVTDKLPDGQVVLAFNQDAEGLRRQLTEHGHMPLPPYIVREDEVSDRECYQTVYAKHDGSVAAPTAGLHFTRRLLEAIDDQGVIRTHVTLHVGGGTFLPVKSEDTKDHVMHAERAIVSAETARIVNECKARSGRVIAVGTTSLRTLESVADEMSTLQPFDRETDIFITPGYRFRLVDALLTNFHLPKSTLFMLVSAFSGLERMRAAYAHCVNEQYRFYSYGDACLLFPEK